MNKPVAVLISDVHYNLQTIQLADAAMGQAIDKANTFRVPLIVAGDLHDTKANLRGECIKAMIAAVKKCESPPYFLPGNHCKIHEKSDDHSLEFLRPYGSIIDYLPQSSLYKIGYLIPYQHDITKLRAYLKTLPKGSQLIMHQGLNGSNSGEYFQDPTALSKEDVSDFRVISGHYHNRQTIKCRVLPRCIGGSFSAIKKEHAIHDRGIGTFDYIGNPYTLNYGEANDPEKGFQVLMSDGSLEFVPTNLRKHQVIEIPIDDLAFMSYSHKPGDLLWLKVKGTREELQKVTKDLVRHYNKIQDDFKLDLIFDESPAIPELTKTLTNEDLLDSLIDSTDNSDERKAGLKELWRKVATNG